MTEPNDLRRLILDSLAAGHDYDSFRTALRRRLREAEAKEALAAQPVEPPRCVSINRQAIEIPGPFMIVR